MSNRPLTPDELAIIREAVDISLSRGWSAAERYLRQAARSYAIHHLDGDFTNNDLANLRLVSIKENRR